MDKIISKELYVMNFDFESFAETMKKIVDFLKTLTGAFTWLNDNIMPLFGTVVDVLMKILDWIIGAIKGVFGFFTGDSFQGIIDFIMGLFS